MKTEIYDVASQEYKEKWNEFVKKNEGSIYQLWEWKDIFQKTYKYKPRYFVADKSGTIQGIFPMFSLGMFGGKRLSSIPFTDFAGPLVTQEELAKELIQKSLESIEEKISIEIFTEKKYSLLEKSLYIDAPFCYFILKTTRPFKEIITGTIHQKTRNMINKAEKMGIKILQKNAKEGLKDYYNLYWQTMIKLLSLPHHEDFFQNVSIFLHDKSKIFFAEYDGQYVAALWTFIWNGTLYIWGNASNKKALSIGANNALYAFVIKYACESSNINEVNFGSTVRETPHHFFKKRFGGQEKPIYRIGNKKLFSPSSIQKKTMKVLRYIPRPLLKKLAKIIYEIY
ncbi:GNAT family N-acetyltransferase [Candidatus Peregrinibacteria bacterium]|nr:GNAT family N-acetyltransferase [Candidatus Peregrinibacteria bacterium]